MTNSGRKRLLYKIFYKEFSSRVNVRTASPKYLETKNPHKCGDIIILNIILESYHTYRVLLQIHFLKFV